MSGIKLSPKYGLNPTMSVCFWCGNEKGEIVLMGRIGDGRKHEDFEAPKHAVINYEPCEECAKNMAKGFTVMEATTEPNDVTNMEMQKGIYPTGRWLVIKKEKAQKIFQGIDDVTHKAFIDVDAFNMLFGEW